MDSPPVSSTERGRSPRFVGIGIAEEGLQVRVFLLSPGGRQEVIPARTGQLRGRCGEPQAFDQDRLLTPGAIRGQSLLADLLLLVG